MPLQKVCRHPGERPIFHSRATRELDDRNAGPGTCFDWDLLSSEPYIKYTDQTDEREIWQGSRKYRSRSRCCRFGDDVKNKVEKREATYKSMSVFPQIVISLSDRPQSREDHNREPCYHDDNRNAHYPFLPCTAERGPREHIDHVD